MIVFALFFCILFYIFYPLFNKNIHYYFSESKPKKNVYRNNLLDQIKELDFEKEMGTISTEDYKLIKSSLLIEISKYVEE